MQFFSFGINHHQVNLEVRDKFAVTEPVMRSLYQSIDTTEGAEFVIFSTCNRTECILYGQAEDVRTIQTVLANQAGIDWPEDAFLYIDEAAVQHVLEVTAGLDSLVLGDAQILGQVKDAYRLAVDESAVGAILHRLMHTAFSTSKRVINETQLGGGSSSVAGTAACLAAQALSELNGEMGGRCLVVGAGQMGRLVVDALTKVDGIALDVINRTEATARELSCAYTGLGTLPWESLYSAIVAADVVIVTSGAAEYVIRATELQPPEAGKETLFIDISVPRNVDPAVSEVAGHRVYDLDALQAKIDGVMHSREGELPAARAICQEMLADFVSWCFHHQAMQPAIRTILDTFDSIRKQELERHAHRFVEADLEQLDRITTSIMQKVLAVPVVRLKNVGPDQIDYVNGIKLLQTLFARNACERPEAEALGLSEHMLEVIQQADENTSCTLSACPFHENVGASMPSLSNTVRHLTLGTRGSALALWQANHIQGLLEGAGFDVTQERIVTRGDKILDKPLALIEGKSLFTKELDIALIEGRIDLAVHSLKDLPSELPEGLQLAAISPRENPHDAFVAHPDYEGTLEELPEGAIIATSSLRRTAQLKAWRPDLQVVPVRGNVDTRLAKLDASNWHGIVLAAAGLIRIGFADRIHTIFNTELMLPAVGQGALGIVCAEENRDIATLLTQNLHDPKTAAAVRSERAFLKCLEGSCHVPVGGFAYWNDKNELILEGLVASLDGSEVVRDRIKVNPELPEEAGTLLATQLLAEGAGEILQLVKL